MSVYYFPTEREEEDEEKPKFKDRCMAQCLKCIDICCIWDCCTCWIYFQEFCSIIVFDPFMELFITLCIVVNTLFMAMDHHDMDPSFEAFLKNGNYVSGRCHDPPRTRGWGRGIESRLLPTPSPPPALLSTRVLYARLGEVPLAIHAIALFFIRTLTQWRI